MSAPSSDRAGIRQAIRALRNNGWDLHYVNDGEERILVKTESEAIDAIMAVDCARLFVNHIGPDYDSGWLFFVLGNMPDEVICDYTTNLESVIEPLTDSWF